MIVHVRQGREPGGSRRRENEEHGPGADDQHHQHQHCHAHDEGESLPPAHGGGTLDISAFHAGDDRAGRRMSTAGPRPVRASAYPPAMSHRSTPERIDQARRAATRSRLIGERVTEETAASCGWSGRVVASHPHPTGRQVHSLDTATAPTTSERPRPRTGLAPAETDPRAESTGGPEAPPIPMETNHSARRSASSVTEALRWPYSPGLPRPSAVRAGAVRSRRHGPPGGNEVVSGPRYRQRMKTRGR